MHDRGVQAPHVRFYDQNVWFPLKDTLRELNKTHSLIDTVCNSLHRLQKQAVTSKHLIASSPAKSVSNEYNKTIRHGDVSHCLEEFHYLTKFLGLSRLIGECFWQKYLFRGSQQLLGVFVLGPTQFLNQVFLAVIVCSYWKWKPSGSFIVHCFQIIRASFLPCKWSVYYDEFSWSNDTWMCFITF